jgi:hypothetical protein
VVAACHVRARRERAGFVEATGITGWAQDPAHPEAPVCLDILAGGRLIGQVLANRYREDLQRAGLGNGRHGFAFTPPLGLQFEPHAVEVRRSLDGTSLAFAQGALSTEAKVNPRPDDHDRAAGYHVFRKPKNRRAL